MSCSSPYYETLYLIEDLKTQVEEEARHEALPKAWGTSWTEHWKDQYQRLRKYDDNNDAEVVIRAIEQERLNRGLPKVE